MYFRWRSGRRLEVATVGAGNSGRLDSGQHDQCRIQCGWESEPRNSARDRSPCLDAKSFRRSFAGHRASITARLVSPQGFGQTRT